MKEFCFLKIHPKGPVYKCRDVRTLYKQWISEFIINNKVDIERLESDRYFMAYKKQLDDFLAQCPHTAHLKWCPTCKKKDHDGDGFCRCEGRNIERAKILREKSESPWHKLISTE